MRPFREEAAVMVVPGTESQNVGTAQPCMTEALGLPIFDLCLRIGIADLAPVAH